MSAPSLASASSRFLYFGYGSNLLRERLCLTNKSAQFVSLGRLNGHRVEFSDPLHSQPGMPAAKRTWHGGAATLVEAPGCEVLGAVWSMAQADAESLDRQEGVGMGIYEKISVAVELFDSSDASAQMMTQDCRCYRMTWYTPLAPSPYYLDIILRGAVQCGLPAGYVNSLRQREHNGYTGECLKYTEVLGTCADDGVPPCQVESLLSLGYL